MLFIHICPCWLKNSIALSKEQGVNKFGMENFWPVNFIE